VQDSGKMARKW